MVRQWIVEDGPFRYDYDWLSQTRSTGDLKDFADARFMDAFGVHPDTAALLRRDGRAPRISRLEMSRWLPVRNVTHQRLGSGGAPVRLHVLANVIEASGPSPPSCGFKITVALLGKLLCDQSWQDDDGPRTDEFSTIPRICIRRNTRALVDRPKGNGHSAC